LALDLDTREVVSESGWELVLLSALVSGWEEQRLELALERASEWERVLPLGLVSQ
jgi:hypothetical protein